MSPRGFVYAARIRSSGLIKIGHSGRPGQRCQALKGDLLAVMPGTREDERRLHRRFARWLAVGREWFRESPEILAFIAEHAVGSWQDSGSIIFLRLDRQDQKTLEQERKRLQMKTPGLKLSRIDVLRIMIRRLHEEVQT